MTNQRKWLLLSGLLLVWGGVTVFQMSDFSDSDAILQSPTAENSLPPIKDLELEATFPNLRQAAKFSSPRNIFGAQGLEDVSDREEKKMASTPQLSEVAPPPPPPPPPGPSAAELAAQRARQQLNQFRFLGYLTKSGESQAFLTNGQAIYIVKQGEMLEGRVQVNKIEPETVVLSTQVWETGNQIQATIPLTPDTSS